VSSILPPAPDGSVTPERRKPISKRVRYEVLRRDNHTCRYCHATDTPLTIDHVTPVALGGSDDPSNLVAACKDCNAGKSSSSPDAAVVAQVADDAVRWSAAMQAAAERLAANKAAVTENLRPWFDEWFVHSGPGWSYKLPSDADEVLRQYIAAGMPVDVLVDAARIALRKRNADDYFRYFRGVANNMLAELQRDATALLAAPFAEADDYQCLACHYRHPRNECGFRTGWRVGMSDCSVLHTDTTQGGPGHPDHYLMLALSRVVDRSAHEWAATWPYPSELYPTYSGREDY
jgi:hypothetical protein